MLAPCFWTYCPRIMSKISLYYKYSFLFCYANRKQTKTGNNKAENWEEGTKLGAHHSICQGIILACRAQDCSKGQSQSVEGEWTRVA